MKRFLAVALAISLLFAFNTNSVKACDETQTNTYVSQILFGDNYLKYESDKRVKMLLSALYLCSEQHDEAGKEKLDFLHSQGVRNTNSLSSIDIKEEYLIECSHNTWQHELGVIKDVQENRKQLLRNTVNKVFDFGFFNNLFGQKKGKCNSFSALLYYAHILADYLADDPSETEAVANGKRIKSFEGNPYIELNQNKPLFTESEKKRTTQFADYSGTDGLGRAGMVLANIGPETITTVGKRPSNNVKPPGFQFDRYPDFVNTTPSNLYNRCHLLAHSLGGVSTEINLITGTRYLNESGMEVFEQKILKYIQQSNNHVLYRVTPIYKGDNLLASGVQMEAYSLEDSGKGLSFNVYCYNVQPGIRINYANGKNEIADLFFDKKGNLPFAVEKASESNPDLIYMISITLDDLFADQINQGSISNSTLNQLADAFRLQAVNIQKSDSKSKYIQLKKCEYEYFEILKSFIPLLLAKEDFFTSVFK